jgi:hypothetical protein
MPSDSSVETSSSEEYEPIEPGTPEPIYKYPELEKKDVRNM